MDPAVSFNVGGTLFTTVRETLLKEAGSRLALMARGAIPSVRDAMGVYFIDRDPKYFQVGGGGGDRKLFVGHHLCACRDRAARTCV